MGWQRKIHPIVFSLALFVIGIFHAIITFSPIDPDTKALITDIEAPVISLGALVYLFLAANRTKSFSPKNSRAWMLLGFAQLVYGLGDLIWAILEVGFHVSPYPSLADFFYLLYYPLFLVAVSLFPIQSNSTNTRTKRTLDLLTIMIGAIALFWNYLLGPIIANSTDLPIIEKILAYAYPLGDLILLWAVLLIFYNRLSGMNAGPIVLITISIGLMVVTDSIFSIQSLNETYSAGGLLDFGWIIQNLLIGSAGFWQLRIASRQTEEHKISSTLVKMANGLFSYYPLVGLLMLMGMLYHSQIEKLPMSFLQLFWVTTLMWIIVFIRQILGNIEMRQLFSQVEDSINTVKNQAMELESANQILGFEISERKKAEERLAFDALHDYLTQLPNRGLFMDRLDMSIQRKKRYSDISFSVLFLDLDQFKQINDTRGHSFGDQLLVLVAARLRECVRKTDTIARLGGDEFIILAENAGNEHTSIKIANLILKEFIKPFSVGSENVYVSVSIGIVKCLSDYEDPNDVLRDADIAMYHAKEAGKSRYAIFNPEMRSQAIERVLIENELRYAIENHEFKLQYQPIYSMETEEIQGFEALIRWHNPRLGLVSPAVFIPVAEESGLIVEIGDWVLFEACSQMKKWHEQELSMRSLFMNVNISGRQFAQSDFVEKLESVLKRVGLESSALKLEITESVLLDNQQTESELFTSLRNMGVHLQIDDFGTGYSSLSYIQHIPVDVIKIDRSFIQEVENGKKYVELISAIIRMAHSLGMETTAEGIETLEQKDVLRSLGCNYAQGYYLSRPLDSFQINSDLLLRKHQSEA